ncbi:peptidyl-prolyl cis-trans isomerase [Algiphilus sp.]|uniref:peptidylprolyl isomerase n=1 Tax=Algiphilus sp. TaxID=1872431 RepID=UPI003B51DDE7
MPSSASLGPRWLREPLVVFALIGGALFALDHGLSDGDAAREIVVSAQRVDALRADFQTREHRPPTAEELDRMIAHWVDNEALFRQARALGLDEDDQIIRRQLIRKMRFLLEDTHPLPEPTREALQAHLQAHPERYGQPMRISFEHVFLTRGAQAPQRAEALLHELRAAGSGAALPPGDPFPGPAQIKAADATAVHKRFGRDFFDALQTFPLQQWSGPIASPAGLHLVRVQAVIPFVPATVDSAGEALVNEVRHLQRERKNADLLEQLRAQFVVRRAPST